jgi:peptidoglycan DL-endopeptidase CwlO
MTLGVAAVRFAERFRGTPYVWAGTTPAGFDCSGFTRFVYAHFGISLPHSSYAQWALGRHVPRSQLRPGDLVFFGLGHVGIWIGAGRFIHAPHTGTVVSIANVRRGWYAASYSGAVRLPGTSALLRPAHVPPAPRRLATDLLSAPG